MAIEGKVRTLFTDKTQQEALFPKTKIKAISDDNGIGLDSILDDMVVAGAAVNDATIPVNADTLGGRPANDYVTDEEVVYYSGDIAIDETVPLNADTLQGYKASDFATADWVKSEIANAQLGGGSSEGEIDLSGFALKADVTAEIDNAIKAIDYPVDSVNGKTGVVTLSAEDVGAAESSHEHAASDITSGTLGVARGGTGANTRVDAIANLMFIGTNPISSTADDTTAKWIALGTGYAWYTTASLLNNQPSQWGFLINYVIGSDVFQIWNSQQGGPTYFRSGNASGWSNSFRKIFDSSQTVPIANGGTGATSRLGAAKALTNEAVSSPNYVVSLTNSWGKFGYTSLAQLMTALGAASATPSISSANNSFHYAHLAKIGKLVICTLMPKGVASQAIYEETITIPSGYRPSANKTFTFYSDTAKNAGSSNGLVNVSVATGGGLRIASTYGVTVKEASQTYCWVTS